MVHTRDEKSLTGCPASTGSRSKNQEELRYMKRETKLLLGTTMILLIALPFIATTVLDVSGQEAIEPKADVFKGIAAWLRGLRQRWRNCWSFDISEDYEEKAIAIAEADPEMQELLADGCKVTRVLPLVKAIVGEEGDVTAKAARAIVVLKNEDSKSFATAWVDLKVGSVTRIVAFTRTVVKGV